LNYAFSDQPTFDEWTIRETAQGQTEEEHFHVEEYYQTQFEVNVTMPAFYFDSVAEKTFTHVFLATLWQTPH
jgi:CD109 antigen